MSGKEETLTEPQLFLASTPTVADRLGRILMENMAAQSPKA